MVVLAVDTSHPEGSVALAVDGVVEGQTRFGATSSHLVELGACVDRLLRDRKLAIADVARVALVEGPGSFTGLRVGMAYVKGIAAALDVEVVTMGTLELLAMPLLRPVDAAGDEAAEEASATKATGWAERVRICPMVDARKGEVYAAVYEWGGGDLGATSEEGRKGRVGPSGAATDDMSNATLTALVEPRAQSPETFIEAAQRFRPLFLGTGANRYRRLVESVAGPGRVAPAEAAIPSTNYLGRIAHRLKPLSREAVRSLEPFYLRPSDAVLKRLKPIDQHD
jgi:tRNA threonylcarbamoyladenosine biosynthesis protein TsaB